MGGWADETDGTREERTYYCQNYRGDVVTLLGTAGGGQVKEHVRYSSYGVPFGIPAGDLDGDGDADNDDGDAILDQQINGPYTVRADLDLDGSIDSGDVTIALNSITNGLNLGRGALSSFGNRKGYAGYEHDGAMNELCHVRHRVYLAELGRWTARDPLGYADSMNMYQYGLSRPTITTDPSGLWCEPGEECPLKIICPDCESGGVTGTGGGGGGGGGGGSSSSGGGGGGGTWGSGGGSTGANNGSGGSSGGGGGSGPGSDGCELDAEGCVSHTKKRSLGEISERVGSPIGWFFSFSIDGSVSLRYTTCATVCGDCELGHSRSVDITIEGGLEVRAGFRAIIPRAIPRVQAGLEVGLFASIRGQARATRQLGRCGNDSNADTTICMNVAGRVGGFGEARLIIDFGFFTRKAEAGLEIAGEVPVQVCWRFEGESVYTQKVIIGAVSADISWYASVGPMSHHGNFNLNFLFGYLPSGIQEYLDGWEWHANR